MNNNLIYLFGMYELDTDSIIVYTNDSNPFIINCQKYNSSVILENPDDCISLQTCTGYSSTVCRTCSQIRWIARIC